MDNSHCTDRVLVDRDPTMDLGSTDPLSVDSHVDPCIVEPGGATTGHKQDSDIGQNLTIDPVVHTGTLELVDESDSDSIFLLRRQASTHHVALPALN